LRKKARRAKKYEKLLKKGEKNLIFAKKYDKIKIKFSYINIRKERSL